MIIGYRLIRCLHRLSRAVRLSRYFFCESHFYVPYSGEKCRILQSKSIYKNQQKVANRMTTQKEQLSEGGSWWRIILFELYLHFTYR